MAKRYTGNVSIHLNTRNELVLRGDPDGAFSNDNAEELFDTLRAKKAELGVEINRWALWVPKGGSVPVLCADRFGKPVVHVLQPREDKSPAKQQSTKIA